MRASTSAKVAAGVGIAALLLFLTASLGLAQRAGTGVRHAGGAPHIGGGASHFGGGAPHFGGAPHLSPHVGAAAPHFTAAPHFAAPVGRGVHVAPRIRMTRHGAPRLGMARGGTLAHVVPHPRFGRVVQPGHGGRFASHRRTVTPRSLGAIGATRHLGILRTPKIHAAARAGRIAGLHAQVTHLSAMRRNFVEHRRLVHSAALRPFLGRHFGRHHLGWVGPVFWPYAYGDIFYVALWPSAYAYYDPLWAYGYDDVYEAVFPPYPYEQYLHGPRAAERLGALKRGLSQSCSEETAEVAGWPIDQIQAIVQPDPTQLTLLDDLGNAVVRASDVIRAHCPTEVSFTPTDRLAQMQERLEGLAQAVDIVAPPLAKFYDSLSDEQKARFNALGAPRSSAGAQPSAQSPQAVCRQQVIKWPAERIAAVVRPNEAQRAKLEALNAAAAQAADIVAASCPSEEPLTPPGRLAAERRHVQAMLTAVETIRPKLDDFYGALSDEQKARFGRIGRQLFAERK